MYHERSISKEPRNLFFPPNYNLQLNPHTEGSVHSSVPGSQPNNNRNDVTAVTGRFFFFLNITSVLFLSQDDTVFVAQHDFKPTNDSDLPFKKGDRLKVLQE